MNRIITLLTLLLLAIPAGMFGQEATTQQKPETEYPLLERQLAKSNEDIVDEKKNIKSKTWLKRAELMMDIYDVNRKYIEGQPKLSIEFNFGEPKETKTEEKDGSVYETDVYDRVNVIYKDGNTYNYVETNKIYDDPLPEALKSLDKAHELDPEGKLDKKLSEDYIKLSGLFEHQGGRAYWYDKDNEKAFESFGDALETNSRKLAGPVVDDTLMYHTGIMAADVGKYEESNKYYKMALDNGLEDPKIYASIKNNYFALGDTTKGVEVLKEGFNKYPESQDLLIEFINYYLVTGRSQEALEYIKKAQIKDPENKSLIFAEAHMYDKNGEPEKAAETYKKVIVMDPEFFDAYFNLGVVYYYYGQDLLTEASDPKLSQEEYETKLKAGNTQLKNAIEPLEKCVSMLEAKKDKSEEDESTLKSVYETLRSIYYRFKKDDPAMEEKFNETDAKLKAVENK